MITIHNTASHVSMFNISVKIINQISTTITRVGYSRGTWEAGSQENLGPQAKFLAGVTPFS